MPRIPLHVKILLGLTIGVCWGLLSANFHWDTSITLLYLKPIGEIFVRLLKMIAVPLVFSSLLVGVASLHDVKKLSRIGGQTIVLYMGTTVLAISIGLLLGNFLKPGLQLPTETRDQLMISYQANTEKALKSAQQLKETSPLQPFVDMVPENLIAAAGSNTGMLQVVFFAIIAGLALIRIPEHKSQPVLRFFDGFNDLTIQIVEYIMYMAPLGVFALMGTLVVDVAGDDPLRALALLKALFWYGCTVVIGLTAMAVVVYPMILKTFTGINPLTFYRAIRPAQLLAFSTSSSNATLPVTMERCEKHLGVSEEVTSFVLPLGATINMDGTSLYQGVAALFIAQALDIPLDFSDQLMIVLTATLASVGSAGVPGAGLVMLVIVLESVGIPTAGIALILAVDRILDMCRTVVNVTGDAMVCTVIASKEKAIHLPQKELNIS
jgi:Na+/H+-dicarboxylate symporter